MKPLIKTAFTHALIALVIQVGLAYWFGFLAAGWIACAVFFGRELAQHEYKGGGPKKVGAFYGVTHHWTLDSFLDVLFPAIATGALWQLSKLV